MSRLCINSQFDDISIKFHSINMYSIEKNGLKR